jgi:hypothetical protein
MPLDATIKVTGAPNPPFQVGQYPGVYCPKVTCFVEIGFYPVRDGHWTIKLNIDSPHFHARYKIPAEASSFRLTLLTCTDISADLSKAVSDLKAHDKNKNYQEAWVSGGDSADLQTLINDTQNATSGGNQLNTDAAKFNSDASGYLSENSPYLPPGWQSGYSTVTNDINAMATDCGQPTAPANTPQNS